MSAGKYKRKDAREAKYTDAKAYQAKPPKPTKHGKPPDKAEQTEKWQ